MLPLSYSTPFRRLQSLAAVLAVSLALASCASGPDRPLFNLAEEANPVVPGFEDIRFYADDDGTNFRDHVFAQVMNQVEVGGMGILKKGRSDWLMISGGGEDGAYGAGVMVGLTKPASDRTSIWCPASPPVR